ncbi:hypothetical protein [Apilactobacillus ozensis]|uniref:hypothetical protein n=1 Tax=Apilactobacillus ozensis TaxID=866801 RepID=UPI000AFDA700|nr:hypothetical protein [Apilactobacillus ozensis]
MSVTELAEQENISRQSMHKRLKKTPSKNKIEFRGYTWVVHFVTSRCKGWPTLIKSN